MDIQKLTTFFKWCTIINGAILILGITGILVGSNLTVGIQSKLFHIPPEIVNAAIYLFLGVFKIFWLVLNVVPFVALLMVGKKYHPI